MSEALSRVLSTGWFNIIIRSSYFDQDKLGTLCGVFTLCDLLHSETCFMKNSKSAIDFIVGNPVPPLLKEGGGGGGGAQFFI